MIKKFIKKVGKGIKKIGKAIGKPFKKLMKTKIGKIIGTIGMMMIGGWMMQGAKAFTTSLFNAQGLGTAFGEGLSAMGQAAQASYKTITEGITGMFTKNGTTTVEAGADTLQKEVVEKAGGEAGAAGGTGSVDVAQEAIDTTKDKILEEGTITPSGKVVGDDAIAKSIEKSLANLPEAGSAGSSLKWDAATNKFIPKTEKELFAGRLELAAQAEPANYIARDAKKGLFNLRNERTIIKDMFPQTDPITGKYIAPEGFTEVSGFSDMTDAPRNLLDKAYDMPFEEIKDRTYGYKPLKSFESLPGIIREGTVGEGKILYEATRPIPEIESRGFSDMSGAYAALDVNVENMYTGPTPSMTQLSDGRTSVPSPAVVRGAADYMANTRKAGFVWDTSLLAVNPSKFAIT